MSEEEKLAREVIARIRAWKEKKQKKNGRKIIPVLAAKFCGGCNPEMDRGALAQIIRRELSSEVAWVPAEEDTDLLLVINGCSTGCADRREVQEKAAECLIIQARTLSAIRKC